MEKKDFYHVIYLHSPYWKNLKKKVHYRDDMTCQLCGKTYKELAEEKKVLEVHHKVYRGFFKEKEEDLITLCSSCHVIVHETLPREYIKSDKK